MGGVGFGGGLVVARVTKNVTKKIPKIRKFCAKANTGNIQSEVS